MTILLGCLSPACAEDVPAKNLPYGALNRALTETVALPAYAALPPAMSALAQATAEFCIDPPTGVYARMVDAFHGAMNAWQRASAINFGPVAKSGRAERFQFWPDTGASTDRQIRRALAERDPAMIAEGGLAGRSIALQNLATFERLLAEQAARLAGGGAASEEDKFACSWMAEIARFQVRLATGVADDWAGTFGPILLGAESGNATYADARAAATDYLKALSATIDAVVRLKLERPMDASVAKARRARAESWRTKRSLDNIVINLIAARDLFAVPGGFGDLLAAAGSAALAAGIRDQFDSAIAHAKGLGKPLEDALEDAVYRPKLDALVREIKALRTLVSGPLASETDLVIGFNSLDGD